MAAYRSHAVGKLIKGSSYVLAEHVELHRGNMQHNNITEWDLMEGARGNALTDSLADVETVRLERDGDISVVLKKPRWGNSTATGQAGATGK
ncbi:YetF domain-containing protein [Hymenobacter sp. CRA2]|uniref:YetF domain-containing protein n=1 Tax=Hymenobacter sp. CRA2 TaxID=1955620 RepID=UPI00098FA49B|nr:YetF domain-containing protein [Hymenobacter sp. CRA2]